MQRLRVSVANIVSSANNERHWNERIKDAFREGNVAAHIVILRMESARNALDTFVDRETKRHVLANSARPAARSCKEGVRRHARHLHGVLARVECCSEHGKKHDKHHVNLLLEFEASSGEAPRTVADGDTPSM